MARTRQPLLVVAAGKDAQVPAHHAEKLVTAARARKKNPGATVVTVPDVTHLLVAAPAGAPGQSAPLAPRQISAEVATAIASWIRGT